MMNSEEGVAYSIFENQEMPVSYATTGQRFANYIIDMIVAYALFMGVIFVLAIVSPDFATIMIQSDDHVGSKIFIQLFAVVIMTLTYALIEGVSRGKTLGKLITRTRAVQEDGTTYITWKQVFIRSISRMVPFEAFSGFSGYPWHDKWSKTVVVKEN